MSIKVVVLGAAGRTGGRIVALVAKDSDLKLVAAIEGPDCDVLGRDAGELAGVGAVAVPVTSEYAGEFDVVIDFSTPRATIHWLAECTRQTKPMVSGTTGHDDIQLERIHEASKFTPVLKAPNMSVGVNVLLRIAEQLGSLLDEAYDVEISVLITDSRWMRQAVRPLRYETQSVADELRMVDRSRRLSTVARERAASGLSVRLVCTACESVTRLGSTLSHSARLARRSQSGTPLILATHSLLVPFVLRSGSSADRQACTVCRTFCLAPIRAVTVRERSARNSEGLFTRGITTFFGRALICG